MTIYLALVLGFYIGGFLLRLLIDLLNLSHVSPVLPTAFKDVFDDAKYRKSQKYLKENTRFSLIDETFSVVVMLPFILLGGFNFVDLWARGFGLGSIWTGLIFFGGLGVLSKVLGIPFSIYHTFGIEKKYGFNKTTVGTFVLDRVKGILLTIIIGAPVLAAVLWIFESLGGSAWIWCWGFLVVFQLVMGVLAPVLIMPLFNKFDPLEDGELKTEINAYAEVQKFSLKGIYKMDGSKRSSKSNAFFTGFGSFRRIVLFDTLIKNHTVPELVAVIAHEMGHNKKKHIVKGYILSSLTSGLMLFVLSLFMNNPGLFGAFKMDNLSIYASFVFFGFLYFPIELGVGIFSNVLSRKHEYEADAYAASTTGSHSHMISALKKLSSDNLSNLTPHPFKVFMQYSHPPVLKRIEALENAQPK